MDTLGQKGNGPIVNVERELWRNGCVGGECRDFVQFEMAKSQKKKETPIDALVCMGKK
jgi:hypothetical protein